MATTLRTQSEPGYGSDDDDRMSVTSVASASSSPPVMSSDPALSSTPVTAPAAMIGAGISTPARAPANDVPAAPRKVNDLTQYTNAPSVSLLPAAPSGASQHVHNLQQLNDAQNTFPANAALFVGNLPNQYTDAELDTELHNHFSSFGHVFVAVRRTIKPRQFGNHVVAPWAIVQYTDRNDACVALQHSHGLPVGGRSIRIEWSRSRRGLYVWRTNLVPPTYNELTRLLNQYGPIGNIALNIRVTLPDGSWVMGAAVEFQNYGSYLRTKKSFHSVYYCIA